MVSFTVTGPQDNPPYITPPPPHIPPLTPEGRGVNIGRCINCHVSKNIHNKAHVYIKIDLMAGKFKIRYF